MKLYETKELHTPTRPPSFSMYEINKLNAERVKKFRKDHELLEKSYTFLMQYEENVLPWEKMTPAQKRWLWAIKTQVKRMV